MRVDLIQSLYHFEVFRTEFVGQRIGLFVERSDHIAILLLLDRLYLIEELG
jgi:hypothetical protein